MKANVIGMVAGKHIAAIFEFSAVERSALGLLDDMDRNRDLPVELVVCKIGENMGNEAGKMSSAIPVGDYDRQ